MDDAIGVSVYGDTTFPDDVSMALAWDFTRAPVELARLTFSVSETDPGGFRLVHTDPDGPASLYFSSSLGVEQVPVPATLLLLAGGLLGIATLHNRRRRDR